MNPSYLARIAAAHRSQPALTVTTNDLPPPSTSNSPNVPVPGSPALHDIALQIIAAFNVAALPVTWVSGFTQIEEADSSDLVDLPDTAVMAAKDCAGTESGTWTNTLSGNVDWMMAAILVHWPGAQIESHASKGLYQGTISTLALTGPTGTIITGPNRLVLWIACASSGGSASGHVTTITPPSGFRLVGTLVHDEVDEFIAVYMQMMGAQTITLSGTAVFTDTSNARASHVMVVVINNDPTFRLFGTLPGTATQGVAYTGTLTLAGTFTGPVTIDTSVGSFPTGISGAASGTTVTISGTPTGTGTVDFTPRATDSSGTPLIAIGSAQEIIVSPPPSGVVQDSGHLSNYAGSSSATFSLAPGTPFTSGNGVVCATSHYSPGGDNIASATCNGTAATKVKVTNDGAFSETIWYCVAGSGAAGWVFTFTGGAQPIYYDAWFQERTDFQASPVDQTGGPTTGTSTTPSVTAGGATTATDELVVAVMGGENGATDTITGPGGSWTTAYADSDGSSQIPCCAAYETLSSTGTPTATFGYGAAQDWQAILATFKLT